jgi:hypothetical protein
MTQEWLWIYNCSPMMSSGDTHAAARRMRRDDAAGGGGGSSAVWSRRRDEITFDRLDKVLYYRLFEIGRNCSWFYAFAFTAKFKTTESFCVCASAFCLVLARPVSSSTAGSPETGQANPHRARAQQLLLRKVLRAAPGLLPANRRVWQVTAPRGNFFF